MGGKRRAVCGFPPVKGMLMEEHGGVVRWVCPACPLVGCGWMKLPHNHSTNTSADVLGTLRQGTAKRYIPSPRKEFRHKQ